MTTKRRPLTPRQRSDRNLALGGRKPIRVARTLRPIAMLKEISEGRVDPHSITPKQRRACLVVMANGTQTSAQLAEVFGVAAGTIRKDILKIRTRLGREASEWTLEQVLGDLVHSAELYAAHAIRQEDPGLAWTIKRDLARLMKDWGIIGRGGQGSTTRITIETIGSSYERMKGVLALSMDPMLNGEIVPEPETIDVEPIEIPGSDGETG